MQAIINLIAPVDSSLPWLPNTEFLPWWIFLNILNIPPRLSSVLLSLSPGDSSGILAGIQRLQVKDLASPEARVTLPVQAGPVPSRPCEKETCFWKQKLGKKFLINLIGVGVEVVYNDPLCFIQEIKLVTPTWRSVFNQGPLCIDFALKCDTFLQAVNMCRESTCPFSLLVPDPITTTTTFSPAFPGSVNHFPHWSLRRLPEPKTPVQVSPQLNIYCLIPIVYRLK